MGRRRLPPASYFNWCQWCGRSFPVRVKCFGWPKKPVAYCRPIHALVHHFAGGPMKPLPIVGDGATLEGSDFPAYLALRLEPLTYPWSTRRMGHSAWYRIENSITGVSFDVEGQVYAGLVTERFNAIEYMRGVRP